jgi:hypothetical protein
MILFADDTNIIYENSSLEQLIQNANADLVKIADWFNVNKLSLNTDKTKFISFTKCNLPINLFINANKISQVKTMNFLGVLIQENLKWNEHISSKTNKISKVTSLLYRLKNTIPESVLLNIYNALIVPHMTYGIVAWGHAPQSLLRRLIILQKKSLRIISKSQFISHTQPLFKKFKLLKLPDLYRLNCCKLYYRTKTHTLPEYHTQQLPTVRTINPYSSRMASDIYISITLSNIEKQSLNYKIGTTWNNIPPHFKNTDNISERSFSKRLKSYFISSYNHYCNVRNCLSCR